MEVVIRDVIKEYEQKNILKIPELVFKKGQVTALIGENGVGKSTLLRMIAGVESYEGQVYLDGHLACQEQRQYVTLVQQKPYLFKRSVEENLEYPLKLRQVPKPLRVSKVNEVLNHLGLEGLRHQKANTLSGGEGQLVALGRALMTEPKLLLLDEITAHLHEETMLQIENHLLTFHQRTGCTIIFVTHHQAQATRLCHQIVTL